MLGFSLKEVKKHWGGGGGNNNALLQNIGRGVSEELIVSTSIDAVYCLMFSCLGKLLCDMPFMLMIYFAV